MKYSKDLIVGTILVGSLLASSTFVHNFNLVTAQSLQEESDQFIQNRCDRVSSNIDKKINNYNLNKEKHIERYNEVKDKLSSLLLKLEAQGINVNELKDDLTILDSKIISFAQEYTKAINDLNLAKTFACGDSEGQFRATVESARTKIINSRDIAKDIINFIKTEIRTDLQQLRDQLKNQ